MLNPISENFRIFNDLKQKISNLSMTLRKIGCLNSYVSDHFYIAAIIPFWVNETLLRLQVLQKKRLLSWLQLSVCVQAL